MTELAASWRASLSDSAQTTHTATINSGVLRQREGEKLRR